MPSLLRLAALTIGPACAAAARPFATLFAVQCIVLSLVHQHAASLPQGWSWLLSTPALALTGLAALLEWLTQHDAHAAQVLRALHLDHLGGMCGTLGTSLLFAALDVPQAHAATGPVRPEATELARAVQSALAGDRSVGRTVALVVVAVALNALFVAARKRLFDLMDDVHLGTVGAWVETGGVLAALALLPFAPVLGVGLVALGAVAVALGGVAAFGIDRLADARARRPCPRCRAAIRVEASLCPQCRGGLVPSVRRGDPAGSR